MRLKKSHKSQPLNRSIISPSPYPPKEKEYKYPNIYYFIFLKGGFFKNNIPLFDEFIGLI